jgi:hypothetical protein
MDIIISKSVELDDIISGLPRPGSGGFNNALFSAVLRALRAGYKPDDITSALFAIAQNSADQGAIIRAVERASQTKTKLMSPRLKFPKPNKELAKVCFKSKVKKIIEPPVSNVKPRKYFDLLDSLTDDGIRYFYDYNFSLSTFRTKKTVQMSICTYDGIGQRKENVIEEPLFLVEFDEYPINEQWTFMQPYMHMVFSATFSGKRSIHFLLYKKYAEMKSEFISYGADEATFVKGHFTRTPFAIRDNGVKQHLIYVDKRR